MNPLMTEWNTPFGLPPFDQIKDDDFAPAAHAAFAEARARTAKIADTSDAPTVENTLHALEQVGEPLSRVFAPFYAILGTCSTPEREAMARDFAPQLAAFSSELTGNSAIFARIEDLWARRDELELSKEQARLLYLTRRWFVRSGAQLTGGDAERMKAIMARLSVLGTEFSQNILADERAWSLPLDADTLATLPEFLQAACIAAGDEQGAAGPVVTLSRSLIVPFLQFCPNRALRAKAYEAWTARGANGGATDNRALAAEILALRHERARLLGYDDFAAYKLETEMAGTPDAVRDLLMQVWQPAQAAAQADQVILQDMLHADGEAGPLEPWDWRYYSAKRRKAEHDLDEAVIKPYFQLDQMIKAAFSCANRLFGLAFAPVDLPLYHEDCRAWEVTRNGNHVALFIGDYFARPGKRSGAWCSAMRAQQKVAGDIRPIVVNVCNFAEPAAGAPALLSFDDVRTLFHEFGHALHQMLSDVTYESMSGTRVARDFVELPSQVYEHWAAQPEVLDEFAIHAQTGAAIPADLRDRLLAAASYDTGFSTVEYLASALVDLAFHEGTPPADPMQKQAEVLADLGMPRAIQMRHATPHFAHVFTGDGYSCGYYSYMWSEVMDADAFDAFAEAGDVFDPELAAKLENDILSRGGTVDAADLYQRFRGRMPGVEPLLRGRGLIVE